MTPQQRTDLIEKLTPTQAGALTVYGEARNQSVSGMQGVLSVIRNRVESGRWGRSWQSVVFAPYQFSCWNDADPNATLLLDLGERLIANGPRAVNPVLDVCLFVAERMVNGDYPDNTHASTHYFAPAVVNTPSWAHAPAVRQTVIGGHAFYSGVR